MGRDADRQHDGTLGAEAPGGRGRGLHGRPHARHHDLAGRVPVGDAECPVRRAHRHEVGQALVGQADDRGHRAGASLAGCLHETSALANEAQPVAQRQDAGRDERAVLAHRVPPGERGRERRPTAAPRRSSSARRNAIDVASSAGWALTVRSSSSAGPSQARRLSGSPSAASASEKTAAAAGDDVGDQAAHAHDLRPLAGEDVCERGQFLLGRCCGRRVRGWRAWAARHVRLATSLLPSVADTGRSRATLHQVDLRATLGPLCRPHRDRVVPVRIPTSPRPAWRRWPTTCCSPRSRPRGTGSRTRASSPTGWRSGRRSGGSS